MFFSRNEHGSVLIITFIILSFALIASFVSLTLITHTIGQSRAQYEAGVSWYAAESGVEQVLFELRKDTFYTLGNFTQDGMLQNGATWHIDATRNLLDRDELHAIGTFGRTRQGERIELPYLDNNMPFFYPL